MESSECIEDESASTFTPILHHVMTPSALKPPEPDPAFEISLRPPMFSEFTGQVKVLRTARVDGGGGEETRRRARAHFAERSARARQNHTGLHHRQRDGREHQEHQRTGDRKGGRARRACSPAWKKATFFSSTRSIGSNRRSKNISIRRWKITGSTSSSTRDRRRAVCGCNLPKFTLIGATTRAGMVSAPLRSRFGMTARLDYYNAEEMQKIITAQRRACSASRSIQPGAAEIAARTRGTPRTANNLLRWVRDYVQVKADGKITAELADRALTMLEIDRDGFDQWDKRIIETLIHKFNGGPVGLNSLAVAVGEEAGTLEEVNEPYLIMEGYIKRTPQGRVATAERLPQARA